MTDKGIEAAAEALRGKISFAWMSSSEYEALVRPAVVAFLRAWEPSMEAQTAGQGWDGMFRCLQRAARAEADRLSPPPQDR
jgi:hypothetical protein